MKSNFIFYNYYKKIYPINNERTTECPHYPSPSPSRGPLPLLPAGLLRSKQPICFVALPASSLPCLLGLSACPVCFGSLGRVPVCLPCLSSSPSCVVLTFSFLVVVLWWVNSFLWGGFWFPLGGVLVLVFFSCVPFLGDQLQGLRLRCSGVGTVGIQLIIYHFLYCRLTFAFIYISYYKNISIFIYLYLLVYCCIFALSFNY